MARLTNAQVKRIFGSFNYTTNKNGSINIQGGWAVNNIVKIIVANKTIWCHRLVADSLQWALVAADAQRLIDWSDRGMGCFVPRLTKRLSGGYSASLSRHAWGIAIDLNPTRYPYGTTKQQPQALLDIMSKRGFEIVVKKDPMHFEFTGFVNEHTSGSKVKEVIDMGGSLDYKKEHGFLAVCNDQFDSYLDLGNDADGAVTVLVVCCKDKYGGDTRLEIMLGGYAAKKNGIYINGMVAPYKGVVLVTAKSDMPFYANLNMLPRR